MTLSLCIYRSNKAPLKQILLLPIAHPHLNPIELVWSWVKTVVGKRNNDFKMWTVKAKTLERINEVTPEMSRNSYLKSDEHARSSASISVFA